MNIKILKKKGKNSNPLGKKITSNLKQKAIHNDKIEINIQVGDIGFFNGRNHLHFRNKLEENINYRGILTHYSKTIENSDDWIKKTSKTPPYENSNGGPLYHKSFT